MVTKGFLVCSLCTFLAVGICAADPEVDLSQSRSLPFQSSDMILLENVIIRGERYVLIMRLDSSYVLKPIWAGILTRVEIPMRSMTIDGDDADWAGVTPLVADPSGDEDPQYTGMPGTDLANLYIARDSMYLYFRMTMHDGNPVQEPQTLYVVEFQQYLTQLHTPGDLSVYVSYTSDEGWTVSVHDRGPGGTVGALAEYPSDHVGIGTGMLEWKVPITAMQFPYDTPHPYFSHSIPQPGIENQFIRVYIHPVLQQNATPVSDSNDEFSRPMIVNFYR